MDLNNPDKGLHADIRAIFVPAVLRSAYVIRVRELLIIIKSFKLPQIFEPLAQLPELDKDILIVLITTILHSAKRIEF